MKNQYSISLRGISILLGFIGLADSIYLLLLKWTENSALCFVGQGGCWSVNNSSYSEIAGIPIALIGSIAYTLILVILQMETRSSFWKTNSRLALLGLSITGTAYSLYLTYVQVVILRTLCPFCLLSAGIQLALLVLSIFRFRDQQLEPNS